jgi:uncharacterized membrane protein
MFIPEDREPEIIRAIEEAEKATSGEIRLHLEKTCSGDAFDRAKKLFATLGMTTTKSRNGVLLYVAYGSRKVAVYGDEGIHTAVGQAFWDEDIAILTAHFKEGKPVEGLVAVIERIGEKLKTYFPFEKDDVNELSNEISFGKDSDHA